MIEAKEINFAYRRGSPVLNDINCKIENGEFVALLGHNGSGKTTLSRLFMALDHPRSGQILIDGEDIINYEPADLADKVGYVFQNGLSTALLRMFTAVPGHACFAVFMGYFYSRAKFASLTNKKGDYTKNMWLTLLIPIVGHGIYDGILFAAQASGADIIEGLGALLWIAYVVVLFVFSFILVIKSAKNDFCIVTLPTQQQTVYRPQVAGNWTCSCGVINSFNFCSACGKPRPMGNIWNCPTCGTLCTYNFCGNCGCPKPAANPVPMPVQQAPAPQAPVPPTPGV